jgi:hypothetical protein
MFFQFYIVNLYLLFLLLTLLLFSRQCHYSLSYSDLLRSVTIPSVRSVKVRSVCQVTLSVNPFDRLNPVVNTFFFFFFFFSFSAICGSIDYPTNQPNQGRDKHSRLTSTNTHKPLRLKPTYIHTYLLTERKPLQVLVWVSNPSSI